MAAADAFEMEVRGDGGHGAMPHLTADAIAIAAQIVTALQTVVSRRGRPRRARGVDDRGDRGRIRLQHHPRDGAPRRDGPHPERGPPQAACRRGSRQLARGVARGCAAT